MRFLERLHYFVALAYYLLFFFPDDHRGEQSKLPLLGILVALALIGHYYEGTRMHQFPQLIGLIIHTSVVWVTQVSIRQTISIISLVFWAMSVGLLLAFGDSDFSRMHLKGPYQVGYKDHRTQKMGSEVSVYYPVDKEEHARVIRNNNTVWLRHGDHTLLGLAKASMPYGREDHPRTCWFRYFRRIRMDTATDAEISKDFKVDKTAMEVE